MVIGVQELKGGFASEMAALSQLLMCAHPHSLLVKASVATSVL